MLNGGGRGGIEPSGIHCCCWFMAPRSVPPGFFCTRVHHAKL